MDPKPRCTLTGAESNVFYLAARVGSALRRAGQSAQADEMWQKLWQCTSYDEALQLFTVYVDVE